MSLTVYKILSFIPSMEAFRRHETFFYGIFGEMKESMSGPSTKGDLPPKVILLNGSSWAKYKGTTMTQLLLSIVLGPPLFKWYSDQYDYKPTSTDAPLQYLSEESALWASVTDCPRQSYLTCCCRSCHFLFVIQP